MGNALSPRGSRVGIYHIALGQGTKREKKRNNISMNLLEDKKEKERQKEMKIRSHSVISFQSFVSRKNEEIRRPPSFTINLSS